MASTREIQLRIKSVTGTQQITRAMKLVSTAKLQKMRVAQESNKPYFKAIYDTMSSILTSSDGGTLNTPLLDSKERAGGKAAYLLVTANRGLAGGYNVNVCRLLDHAIADQKDQSLIVTIGKKGRDYFERRGYTLGEHFELEEAVPEYTEISRIVKHFTDLKVEGKADVLYVVYTAFKNTLAQYPVMMKVLPFSVEDLEPTVDRSKAALMNYEPDEEAVLDYIIPKYITGIVYGAVVEAFASEESARMTAMDSATENAEEIVEDLTLKYNRARQGHITQELTEIVNGANALNQ